MRLAPIGAIAPTLLDFSTSSDVREWQPGTRIQAVGTDFDTTANVANWGMAELMYVSSQGAVPFLPGYGLIFDKNFRVSGTFAGQANTGSPICIALTAFQIGSTTEQWGWVLVKGTCPIKTSGTVTSRVFLGADYSFTGVALAGGQILNAVAPISTTAAFTRSGRTVVGSSRVAFPNVAGMFPGQAISGTGIPASSVISSVDSNGTTVVIGSAVGTPVVATAAGNATMTLTLTGYAIINMQYPFIQGQIT